MPFVFFFRVNHFRQINLNFVPKFQIALIFFWASEIVKYHFMNLQLGAWCGTVFSMLLNFRGRLFFGCYKIGSVFVWFCVLFLDFRQIVDKGHSWESYAFIDLISWMNPISNNDRPKNIQQLAQTYIFLSLLFFSILNQNRTNIKILPSMGAVKKRNIFWLSERKSSHPKKILSKKNILFGKVERGKWKVLLPCWD